MAIIQRPYSRRRGPRRCREKGIVAWLKVSVFSGTWGFSLGVRLKFRFRVGISEVCIGVVVGLTGVFGLSSKAVNKGCGSSKRVRSMEVKVVGDLACGNLDWGDGEGSASGLEIKSSFILHKRVAIPGS